MKRTGIVDRNMLPRKAFANRVFQMTDAELDRSYAIDRRVFHIVPRTERMWIQELKRCGDLIREIPCPTEEECLAAVGENPFALGWIAHPSLNVCVAAAMRNKFAVYEISNIHLRIQTEMTLELLKDDEEFGGRVDPPDAFGCYGPIEEDPQYLSIIETDPSLSYY